MPGFRFMPEVSYLKPIAQFGAGSPAVSGGTEHLVQFGLGALVGGD